MIMKGYSTFVRFSDEEPFHKMLFNVIPKTPLIFVVGVTYPSAWALVSVFKLPPIGHLFH